MANMARKTRKGVYQIGIYAVEKTAKGWTAHAVGPGTLGDGFIATYPSLAAAHLALTGEPRCAARYRVLRNGSSLTGEAQWLQRGGGGWGARATARTFATQEAAEPHCTPGDHGIF